MDQAVIQTGLFGEFARRDARVPDTDQQPFGGVEKGLFGLFARGRDPDPLALCGFDG
jgi:hypothetical protein